MKKFNGKDVVAVLKKNMTFRRFLVFSLILVLFLMVFKFKEIFAVIFLVILNWGFAFIKRKFFLKIKVGRLLLMRHIANAVEFITFSTVIASYTLGLRAGILVGCFAMIGTYVFEARISKYAIITVPAYIMVAVLAYYLRSIEIVTLGIFLSIGYNLFNNIIISFLYRAKLIKMASFILINILFNVYLFKFFGPVFV